MDHDRAREVGRLASRPCPEPGFAFVARPRPGWRGIVDCEVLEARDAGPDPVRFSWTGDDNGKTTYVAYRIEPHAAGDALQRPTTTQVSPVRAGFLLAKLLGSVRKKMLTAGLSAVLDDLDETGTLRATSTLRTKPLS